MVSTLLEHIYQPGRRKAQCTGCRDQRLCARRTGLAHGGPPRLAGTARQHPATRREPCIEPAVHVATVPGAPLAAGGHAQTIWPLLIKGPLPRYRRERWDTPDGDFIDLDWIGGTAGAPCVVLFHGLEGSSRSHYARA
jgi:hypothetical protein